MRSTTGLRVLAIAGAAAAIGAPAAYAVPIQGGGGGIPQPAPVTAPPNSSGSPDWALIGAGTAGGVGLLSAALTAGRRVRLAAKRA